MRENISSINRCELVVKTSRHNLYCLKPIRGKDDKQGVEDKCDKGL